MKMIIAKPPIWDEAHRQFAIDDSVTFYTYGDTIYNPAGVELEPDILVHESTHSAQQKEIGGPEIWWPKYFNDTVFRLQMEAEAYGAQYRFYCEIQGDRNKRFRYLNLLSGFLASPLYKIGLDRQSCMSYIHHYAVSPPPRRGSPPSNAVEPPDGE